MGFFQKQLCKWSTIRLSLKGQSEPLCVGSSKFHFSKDNSFEYYEHTNEINSLLVGGHENFQCHEEVYDAFFCYL